ncbi:uncharacterized protein Z518_08916 [Rhinocladiella mackenziei CBS 650.93]|uniref:O-methyltransferase C-terminal domain-containing protein n=1 Tax=Rhinocladiella mackenziei CBS 650.93 TaxID=1442369 RepID=A0A0D2ID87_9EURO|nr:uncharacterized protein Z518_08916 [Rhinocladiella mackenziei CBS 650.93]KIX01191.1 hypothetical protein Z518_08916 [Rhinocladiella mackenziei CBS 650.93]
MAPRIDQLVATNTISDYLQQNNLPHPSFDADGPITLNLSPQAERVHSTAIDALQELLDLLQGPIACMLSKYNGTRHDLIQGAAEGTDLHVNDPKRIMRFAMSFHLLFAELQEGFVAHSAGSKKIASEEIVRTGLAQPFDNFYGSFARGLVLVHSTDKTMFDFLRTQPSKADQFNKAMRFYSESHLVEGYDWDALDTGTVVDVGGADGHVSRALSKAHPQLNMVVEDLPDVVTAAEQASPTQHVRYQAHDFFTTQPATAADTYLFRWVFHD